MFAASGLRTGSNPRYIEAVKRQKEKERQRLLEADRPEPPKLSIMSMSKLFAYRAEVKRKEEELWNYEFQQSIMLLWYRAKLQPKMAGLNEKLLHFNADQVEMSIGRMTAEQIIREGVKGTPFTVEDIKGPTRYKAIAQLRQLLMGKVYLECPHLSLPQIGKAFGGRDHTTILHAVQKLGLWPRENRAA